jgi:acetyl-CoA carboxylase biotin carboxyl carrier protein
MTNSGAVPGDVFDVRKVRRLVELMNEHDLAEIDLRQADQRIRLRKGAELPSLLAGPTAVPAVGPVGSTAPAPAPVSATPAGESPAETTNTILIKSPMVGTFYTSSSPDVEPFVKVGDHVNQDTTVCIVEAMKVFNEIPAECSGQIVAVLVDNGDPVEFGQALFKVDPGK